MTQRKNKNRLKNLILEQEEVKLSDSVIVGAYSIDQNREFHNNMSALKYFKKQYEKTPQDVNINLKELCKNMEMIERRAHNYLERLTNLTRFIQENPKKFIKNKKVDADFVCFRGVLMWILRSYYDFQGFILEAVKIKGTIYLALKTVKQQPPPHLTIFESCLLCSDPKDQSSEIRKDEFNLVLSRNVNELKVLFAAECDGLISEDNVDSLDDLNLSRFVEIKCRFDKALHNNKNFKDLTKLNYWCQSFIASINTIYIGKRDDQDIVKRIEKIDVKSLEEPEHSAKFWDKKVCLQRLREFLRHIKADMQDVDDPNTVFCYEWKERFKKGSKNQFPILPEEQKNEEFLSREYISFINNLK